MNDVLEERSVADSRERGRVKVVDRRWFTAEGELRDTPAEPARPPAVPSAGPASARKAADEPAPPPAPPEPEPATDAGGAAGEERSPLPAGPGISDIVDLLAQQAMAFLSGQVPGRGRDPATARYFIDLVGVLKDKTAGRLSLEETNFLDDVLYQLRSLFVSATR